MRALPIWMLGCSLAIGCADLPPVPAGVCGNLVVDPGEQCDGEASCATTGPAACRYTCDDAQPCPGALACSTDHVCVESAGRFTDPAHSAQYTITADQLEIADLDGDGRDDVIGIGASLRIRYGAAATPLGETYEKRIRAPRGPLTIGQLDGRPGLDLVFPTDVGVYTLVARGRELEAVPYASVPSLPDDSSHACTRAGWTKCRTGDFNHDGLPDRVGFVAGRDNVELELGRATDFVTYTLDTADLITDIATGDLDGDGFSDVAFSTRASAVGQPDAVDVVYGSPQPESFVVAQLVSADHVAGLATGELSRPADGVDDLAVSRTEGGTSGVAVYFGDTSRDLSAPFQLLGGRPAADTPYALVAGEFVGGAASGTDVMVYARNGSDAYLWWLRGTGGAQLMVGAIDPFDGAQQLVDGQWRVGNLVPDTTAANGPDEVIGLATDGSGCAGPALTVAVPSARFTGSQILRQACLDVDGAAWQPSLLGLLRGRTATRTVGLAQVDARWWLGETTNLDADTASGKLPGTTLELDPACGDAQLWHQTPDNGTFLSWTCDHADSTSVVTLHRDAAGVDALVTAAEVPLGSRHLVGDLNGDGLTDLLVTQGAQVTVLLQCSVDMVGVTPGC